MDKVILGDRYRLGGKDLSPYKRYRPSQVHRMLISMAPMVQEVRWAWADEMRQYGGESEQTDW